MSGRATDALVRRAQSADRDQILTLAGDLATSYEVQASVFGLVFETLLAAETARVLVAEKDAQIVGYLLAQLHHTFHANGPVVWIEEVLVAASHRGSGVGRAMMSAAELWAHEEGCAYVALATRRASGFYERLGYEPSASYYKRPISR
ncbi:GNAT family N-acetyltransferase [Microlunatus ginsengisoli]|uniref:GNAT family N-acetyltransferase n=1 Tax=Microlunatus ginsengisoli TaxID=363863 RepID=A0ABP6ZTG7_9ACTN